uniref:HTH cro/C1-type domain-containing protein n=1 Tax=uncultured prokaryote TaxID=198431 RepID=A0A0H5QME5_9ZZZZ|nr:hypothetical protein [uncultured prokaryote]
MSERKGKFVCVYDIVVHVIDNNDFKLLWNKGCKKSELKVLSENFDELFLSTQDFKQHFLNNQNKTSGSSNIKNFGKGKTATMSKIYKNVIREFRKEKKTIRQIAQIIGISPATVQKIVNELKTEN